MNDLQKSGKYVQRGAGSSHCLLVVFRLDSLDRAMEKSKDLHDVI